MTAPSSQDIISSMTRGSPKWDGSTLTFSLPTIGSAWTGYGPGSDPFLPGYATFTASQADMFRSVVGWFRTYLAINFAEVTEPASVGRIRAAISDPSGNESGWAYGPSSFDAANPQAGDIWISSKAQVNLYLLAHELSHALGMKHPYESGTLLAPEYWHVRYSVLNPFTSPYVISIWNDEKGLFYKTEQMLVEGLSLFDILTLQSLYGASTETGKGDTVYALDAPRSINKVIYDASGVDTIDASTNTRRSIIDLTPGAFSSIGIFTWAEQVQYYSDKYKDYNLSVLFKENDYYKIYTWENNVSIAFGTTIENAKGGAGDDMLRGNYVANVLEGGGGSDQVWGGGGDDLIDGGAGFDTVLYDGASTDYRVSKAADGAYAIVDLRAGAPDARDVLRDVEVARFSDRSIALSVSFAAPVEAAFNAVLRVASSFPGAVDVVIDVGAKMAGGLSEGQAIAQIVKAARSSTSVATLAYEFFTGKIPSQAGIDYLVSPTGPNANNLNSAYYQSFNLENRYINFAVNLGKLGEGKDAFAAKYGSLSLVDATGVAYKAVFGAAPTEAKIHAMIDNRVDYFAYYGGDGPSGVGTKAAMVGWLLVEAQKAGLGVMVRSNDAWLIDLSDGSAPFAVDILDPAKGYWKADFIFGGS